MMRAIYPTSPISSAACSWRRSIAFLNRSICFFDHENDPLRSAFSDLDLVAGILNQIWNVDHRERIGTVDLQQVARLQGLQRLARFERRQRALQSGEIEFGRPHARTMRKRTCTVNGWRISFW